MRIKSDRIELKPFSLEWANYHFLAVLALFFGLLQLYFFLADCLHGTPDTEWLFALCCFAVSYCLYLFKSRKLKHKRLDIACNDDIHKAKIITLLEANGWEICYNNRQFLQASYLKLFPCSILFILIWKRNRTLWNCIYDPFHHGLTLGLLSDWIGRKVAKKIERLADDGSR